MQHSKLHLITILGILQFLILSLVAMFFYSGGNLNNPNFLGYCFCLNKLSDLGMTISYSGKSNWISFWIFNSSLIIFSLSLITFVVSVSSYFKKYSIKNLKLIYFTLILGITASVCFAIVGLTPKNLKWTSIPHHAFLAFGFFVIMIFEICYCKIIFQTPYPNSYAWIYMGTSLIQLTYFFFLFEILPFSLFFLCLTQKIVVYVQLLNFLIQSIGFINNFEDKFYIFEQKKARREEIVLDLHKTSKLSSFLIKFKDILRNKEDSIIDELR